MNPIPENSTEYSQARFACYFSFPEPGSFQLTGEDRVQFLQRQSTNDIRSLQPGHSILTVLTSPTARILDVLTLIAKGDHILALTLPGSGESTVRMLRSKIFFMDKVTITDTSSHYLQINVDGTQAAQSLDALGLKYSHEPGEIQETLFENQLIKVIAQTGLFGVGFRLVFPGEILDGLTAALEARGFKRLSHSLYDLLRIEAGLPWAGHELSQEYTPLETNLEHAISPNKGCYTGQEIIARQITYDKVTRSLVGLRLERLADNSDRVFAEGKPIGEITSSTISPEHGPIALAVLKRPYDQPGETVKVQGKESEIQAVTSSLPFE